VNLELYWVHLKGGFEVPWFRSNVSGLQGFEQSPDEECLCLILLVVGMFSQDTVVERLRMVCKLSWIVSV
jgi:hypothetical protein